MSPDLQLKTYSVFQLTQKDYDSLYKRTDSVSDPLVDNIGFVKYCHV
jgi:hypothetical protein